MFRRLLSPLSRTFFATVGLLVLGAILVAQQPAADVKPDEIKKTQEENKKRYARLTGEILKLALRWEKSDNPSDQERAKTLRAVLKIADERGLDNLFKQLIEGIDNKNTGDLQKLIGNDEKLIAALEEIINTLETEDEYTKIKRDIQNLKDLIKEVERLKREQENVRARTENPRTDADKIAKDQNNLAKQTQDLANKLAGKDPKGGKPNAGAPKDDKSEPKPETKPGESAPEAKPDTKENKSDSKGDGSPMPGEPKAGGEPKESPKGMEAGSNKESPKDSPMAGEPKAGGEPKPMDPKGGEPKAGEPKAANPGESKAQGQGKAETKPSDGQAGEGKPMTSKDGQPSASKPSSGQPSSGQPSSGQPSDSQPGPQTPKDQAQENIQQAVPQQQGAEQDIKKNERPDASKKQDKAIQSLEEAIKELEKRLKQLREKELAKLLGTLEERVTRMLRMQQEVYEATKTIDRNVKKNNNQKSKSDLQRAHVESDKENDIVVEADKTLKLMEGEGTAVVFAGVLAQVREDMIAVKKRLEDGRVDGRNTADKAEGTQLIEEDIIEQLTMMKEALKKAKQDLENQQSKPSDSNSANKPNQKLIDLINELKLIKSLQEQVNKRTVSYSKQDPNEQAKDPLIQAELKQLSDRQRVLQEMLHKIATEANQ